MEMSSQKSTGQPILPPGFRFHPTDEELVVHYLKRKAASTPLPVPIITEVDLYKFDPWELPDKANFGEHEWYFFSPRDRKYPNGARPNRAAASGYWKATGTDKPITTTSTTGNSQKVGVKKALVFYKGRPPKGVKTSWIMHEYRLTENAASRPSSARKSLRLDDWVLCRIYKKTNLNPKLVMDYKESSCLEEVFAQLPNMDNNKFSMLPKLAPFNVSQDPDHFMSSILSDPEPKNIFSTRILPTQHQQPQKMDFASNNIIDYTQYLLSTSSAIRSKPESVDADVTRCDVGFLDKGYFQYVEDDDLLKRTLFYLPNLSSFQQPSKQQSAGGTEDINGTGRWTTAEI